MNRARLGFGVPFLIGLGLLFSGAATAQPPDPKNAPVVVIFGFSNKDAADVREAAAKKHPKGGFFMNENDPSIDQSTKIVDDAALYPGARRVYINDSLLTGVTDIEVARKKILDQISAETKGAEDVHFIVNNHGNIRVNKSGQPSGLDFALPQSLSFSKDAWSLPPQGAPKKVMAQGQAVAANQLGDQIVGRADRSGISLTEILDRLPAKSRSTFCLNSCFSGEAIRSELTSRPANAPGCKDCAVLAASDRREVAIGGDGPMDRHFQKLKDAAANTDPTDFNKIDLNKDGKISYREMVRDFMGPSTGVVSANKTRIHTSTTPLSSNLVDPKDSGKLVKIDQTPVHGATGQDFINDTTVIERKPASKEPIPKLGGVFGAEPSLKASLPEQSPGTSNTNVHK
jgi:hypothetical protein